MAVQSLDAKGLKCPQPTLKITGLAIRMAKGDVLEVVADCPTFEKDVRQWCARYKKPLIWMKDMGGGTMSCQIQF